MNQDEGDLSKPAQNLAQALARFDKLFAQPTMDNVVATADWQTIRAACAPFAKTESPVFLSLAVSILNGVKAWKDGDSKIPIPVDLCIQMDALLMAWEMRRSSAFAEMAAQTRSPMMKWAVKTFGDVALNVGERAARFSEEALELAHAVGLRHDIARAILDRVYAGQRGDRRIEVGQSQLTLDLLAEALGLDPTALAADEFSRIQRIPQSEWDRRHAAKVELGIAMLPEGKP